MRVRILGLDLGTDTGIAFYDNSTITSQTWKLGTPKEIREWGRNRATRRGDPRILRFYEKLENEVVSCCPDAIVFEDVCFSTYTLQTQLWSSFRAVVWLIASKYDKICECVPVSTLKKFATGHGGATKEMMQARLIEFKNRKLTDDEVDAIWVIKWAINRLARA